MKTCQATVITLLAFGWIITAKPDSVSISDQLIAAEDATTLIKISTDLLPAQSAQHARNLTWPVGFYAPDVYCVADLTSPIERLEFDCEPDCSAEQRSQLRQKTANYGQRTGYAAIKLTQIWVDDPKKWHDKRLLCRGFGASTASDPDSKPDVAVSVDIRVLFMDVPRISIAYSDSAPLVDREKGIERLFMSGDQMTVQCDAPAFPPADRFEWWEGSTKLDGSSSRYFAVTRDFVDKFLRCQAHNGRLEPKTSPQVLIEKAVIPFMIENNFQNIRDTYKNNVAMGSNIRFECSFGAWPAASIDWFFENITGSITRLSCSHSGIQYHTDRLEMGGMNYQRSNSSCLIDVTSFNHTGTYWCSACIEIAKNDTVCDVGSNTIPHHAVHLNVSGAPIRSEQTARLERSSESSPAIIYEPVCANPRPMPSETFLICGNDRISMYDSVGGVSFQQISQMTNSPFCYEVWISFSDLGSISRSYYCTMSVGNSIGTLQYIIPVGTYIASNRTNLLPTEILTMESADNTVVIICISLVVCAICMGAICAYAWSRRKACFSYRKTDINSDDFRKTNTKEECLTIDKNGALIENGLEDKDGDNQRGNRMRSEPATEPGVKVKFVHNRRYMPSSEV